ncbi:MAG: hypothetical protein AAGE80_13910 [Pseudomonadota bacterium]
MGNTLSLIAITAALPAGLLLAFRLGFKKVYLGFVFGVYLFLPEVGVSLPYFIPVSKREIIGFFSLIFLISYAKEAHWKGRFLVYIFVLMLFVGIIISNIFNQDTVFSLGSIYQGVTIYDGVAKSVKSFIVYSPFLVGLLLFCKIENQEKIIEWILFFGILYGTLIWFEARMSPQLHANIYGFFQHSFAQHIRGGGFRPIVFLPHALHVAFFAMLAFFSLIILMRARLVENDLIGKAKGGFLFISILLCKSLGSITFTIVFLPVIWVMSPKMIQRTALILAVIAMTFPVSRSLDVFPTDQILEIAEQISPGRAASLATRFNSEDLLIDHALERPVWGWGTHGRNGVSVDGRQQAIFDGFWIIVFGSQGIVGFVTIFGLLFYPIFLIWRLGASREIPIVVAGLSLLLAINMIELLPNSTIGPWTWLIAGSLTGWAINERRMATSQNSSTPGGEKSDTRPRTVI